MEYLSKISEADLRRELLDALAQLTREHHIVARARLVQQTLSAVRERSGWTANELGEITKRMEHAYGEFRKNVVARDQTVGEAADVRRFESLIWELVAQGSLYPRFNSPIPTKPSNGFPYLVQYLVLTPTGERLLARRTQSPYHGEWVQRVCGSLADLPDDIPDRLQDARDCLRARVLRPAVVMAGLACERTVASVYADCNLCSERPCAAEAQQQAPQREAVARWTRRGCLPTAPPTGRDRVTRVATDRSGAARSERRWARLGAAV